MTEQPGPWEIRPDHEMPDDDPYAMTLTEGRDRVAAGDLAVAVRTSDVLGGPVDRPPEPTTLVSRVISTATVERPPIVSPLWYRRTVQKAFLGAWWGDLWYKIRFHAWKGFGYVLAWLWWAARGIPVAAGRWLVWVRDPIGKEVMDSPELSMHRDKNRESHNEEIRQRLAASGLTLVAALVAWVITVVFWRQFGRYCCATALAAALVALIRTGKPEGKKFVTTATVTRGGWSRLTSERVRRAFVQAGIIKDPASIEFPREVVTAGPGELLYVQMPEDGLAAQEVVAKRLKIANALRVPLDQIYLEPATGRGSNVGLLELLMTHEPTSELQRYVDWPKWPLLAADARSSFFQPIPIAHDIQFRPIFIELDETNTAIAGRSGSGKSSWLQKMIGAAALDPIVELRTAEYKGVGDFVDAAPLMPTYICGLEDEDFAAGVQLLAWGLRECDLRGPRLRAAKLAGKAPDGKVTPELAATPGSGLHPILISFDEIHELFEHEVFGKDAIKLAKKLHRRGRALGIHFVFATQIPDKNSVPPILLRNSALRVCCAVKDHIATNMILGTGAFARGWDPTQLRPKVDGGWGFFAAIEDPKLVRSYDPTREELLRLYKRASDLRGGRVVGAPIDPADVPPPRDVLIDVEEVFRELGWDKAQWQEIVGPLAEKYPATYTDLTAEALSADARQAGSLPHRSVKPKDGSGKSAKGCHLADIREAVERRQIEHQERQEQLALEAAEPDPDDWDDDLTPDPDAEPDTPYQDVDPDAVARLLRPASLTSGPARQAQVPGEQDLLLMAAELVIVAQHGSAPMLQRKLRIGHVEAESLMDELCALEVVGPPGSAGKFRSVLIEAGDADDAVARLAAERDLP